MKRILIVSMGILLVLLIGVGAALYPSAMADIRVRGVDLTTLADGSYTGTFERGRFTNTLTVHIENNRIVRIDIVEDVFAASVTDASDEVFRRVIETQDTKIDAVAGATITTKAYLKSIENALVQ